MSIIALARTAQTTRLSSSSGVSRKIATRRGCETYIPIFSVDSGSCKKCIFLGLFSYRAFAIELAMFRRSTTFVIGAGCSKELGLPLGLDLMSDIYRTIKEIHSPKYHALQGAFLRCGVANANIDVDRRFAAFAAGLFAAPSIDQYLDFHRDDDAMVALGKCAIATEILYAETNSDLGEAKYDGRLPSCWLRTLFHLMAEGTTKQDPAGLFHNINFICFNYDRTIELFFLRAVMSLVHCTYDEARLILRGLRIWHPYGVVGGYEVGQPGISTATVAFSDERIDEFKVLSASQGLQTFTQGMADEKERDAIRSKLATAQQIVFLGFGYLDQNMELLRLRPSPTDADQIHGTVYGMSPTDADIAREAIARSLGGASSFEQTLRTTAIYGFSASETLEKMGKTFRS